LKCLNEGIIFGFLVQAKIQTKKKNSIQTGPKIIENQMDVIIICVLIGWKGGRGATTTLFNNNLTATVFVTTNMSRNSTSRCQALLSFFYYVARKKILN